MNYKNPISPQHGTMRALIVYDDVASASRAMMILRRALSRAKVRTHLDLKPWRLGILRLPIAANEALLEGVDADVIVLAELADSELQPWLMDWLQRWSVRRKLRDSALVVTCADPHESPSAVNRLLSFAAENNLNLIIEANSPLGADLGTSVRVQPKGESPALTISDVRITAAGPKYSSYRNWGINE